MTGFDIQYDPCSPPICSDDISIRILSYSSCVEYDNNITISWIIDNNSNTPLSNNVLWSFNDKTFSNIVTNESNEEPYYAFLTASSSQGLIYFKIKTNINGTFYESDIYTININSDCGDNINIIPTNKCDCISINNVLNNLWVEEKGFPLVINEKAGIQTIYFKYNNNCYYIDNNSYINKEIDSNDINKTVINFDTSVSLFNYFDCDDCCISNNCDIETFNSGINENNGQSYFLNIGSTTCLTIQHKAYFSNRSFKIIVSNSDTAQILYNSNYTSNTDWNETDININGISEINVTIITQLNEIVKWEFNIKCCDE